MTRDVALGRQRSAVKVFTSMLRSILPVVTAVLAALAAGAMLILISGHNPLVAYLELFRGAFIGRANLANTLQATTPLLYTGLSFMIAFRAGIFNSGGDGQLMVGALAATVAGVLIRGWPAHLHVPLAMGAGILAGAVWALVPALVRLRYGANEIISTMMMNFVALYLTDYLVQNHFKGSGVIGTTAATPRILASAQLASIMPPYLVTAALPAGILLAILLHAILRRTVYGYEINITGTNSTVAEYAGISVFRVMLTAMLVSGGVAGLGGATLIMGVQKRFVTPFVSTLGLNGIIACLLGRNRPLGVVVGAFFLGALQSGGLFLQYRTFVSERIILVLSGLIILFVTATELTRFSGRTEEGATR